MQGWIFWKQQKELNDGWVLTTVVTCQWQKNQFWWQFESKNEMIKIDFGMKKSGNIWTQEANEGNMLNWVLYEFFITIEFISFDKLLLEGELYWLSKTFLVVYC